MIDDSQTPTTAGERSTGSNHSAGVNGDRTGHRPGVLVKELNRMGPAGFACMSVEAGPRTVCVAVSGEVDLATADQLDHALSVAQRDAELVTLDLRRLRFMDCQGLAVVMSAATRAQVNGARFRVVRGPPPVNRVFVLTGIDRTLEMTTDVD